MKKNICRYSVIITAMSMLLAVCVSAVSIDDSLKTTREEVPEGFVCIESFGGYSSDGEDDTAAFEEAVKTGKNIYLLKGTYEVSRTIQLEDQELVGAGGTETTIISAAEDVNAPVLRIGGACTVKDLGVQFKEDCITKAETQGQRVGIELGISSKDASDSHLTNVHFQNIGTGLYAPSRVNGGGSRMLIDTACIREFTYRGVDFQKVGQYGNLFSNIYIGTFTSDQETSRNACFAVEGDEYNLQVDQLNTEGTPVEHAILLKNCHGGHFGSVHMENIWSTKGNNGLVYISNSNVNFEGITLYYNRIVVANSGVFELSNASDTGNYLKVGTLHLKGLNSNYDGLSSNFGRTFKFVKRSAGAAGNYNVNIDRFAWYSWLSDRGYYESFPCDETGITYLSKGFE